MFSQTSLKIAFASLLANKTRTALTVLGVVIGIASVIIVYAAGEGINGLIMGQISSFGGNDMVQSEIQVPNAKQGGKAQTQSASNLAMGVQITTLTLDDMDDIDRLPLIKDSYAGIIGQELVSYGSEMKKSMLFGTTASYINIDKSEMESGSFFTEAEDKSLSQVVVLGKKIKEKLFGDSDPIGQSVSIRQKKFRVIGVLKERGVVMVIDFDDFVYVPIRTLQKKVMGIDHVIYLMHKIVDEKKVDEAADEIRAILRQNHDIAQPITSSDGTADLGKDDFRVTTMVESMKIMDTVTGAITLLLLAIVAISLVVGGVGIMNIMYVIVSERTSEIGLRKAVGARYSDIMLQFLLESVLITLIGGIVGVLFGVFAAYLIFLGANYAGLSWQFSIPIKAFAVAFGFSSFFGIAFGLYPARKAAKMSPIEALRKE